MAHSDSITLTYDAGDPPLKTVDFGLNGTTVSADPLGRILQLSVFHPKHGIVQAEPFEQFDGSRFRDTPYVREYRERALKAIKSGVPGFGIRLDVDPGKAQIELPNLGHAEISYQTEDGLAIKTSLRVDDAGELSQSFEIVSKATAVRHIRYVLDLGISVNRASYGQLTEGGPIPLPKSKNDLSLLDDGLGFMIINPYLGAHLQGCVEIDGQALNIGSDVQGGSSENSIVLAAVSRLLTIQPNASTTLTARFRLRPGVVHGDMSIQSMGKPLANETFWMTSENTAKFIVRRNLEYILGNCAIPLNASRSVICLLTDHVALPLGWMRDNYWQCRFLMDLHPRLGELTTSDTAQKYSNLVLELLKGHLRWIFSYAQRPQKFWHRSYLATGRPKDGPVFQLDQQCYPLLELSDFLETFPEEAQFVSELLNQNVVEEVVDVIEAKRDAKTGLFATEETPGDDEVEFPFHFSSHVLLWHTFSQLARCVRKIAVNSRVTAARLEKIADQVRQVTLQNFLCAGQSGKMPMFSYLTNGDGLQTFYHDANDIPTLCAPGWGFVKSSAELHAWRNTMRFAFSADNDGGFFPDGAFGGLGSVHTKGPWPLGFYQAWRYAQMTEDRQLEESSWLKICGAMQWDGLFSEAVDRQTGQCTSKAWFSWPGSMISSGLLQPGVRDRYL